MFSYLFVVNTLKNNLDYNRFSIIIWAKSVENNISRNYFRRTLFNIASKKINSFDKKWLDIVFFVKKQTKLNIKDKTSFDNFLKDVNFILYKNNI